MFEKSEWLSTSLDLILINTVRFDHQIMSTSSRRGTCHLNFSILLLNALAPFPTGHPHLRCKGSFKCQNLIPAERSSQTHGSSHGGWQIYLCTCPSMELLPVITAVHIRTWQALGPQNPNSDCCWLPTWKAQSCSPRPCARENFKLSFAYANHIFHSQNLTLSKHRRM